MEIQNTQCTSNFQGKQAGVHSIVAVKMGMTAQVGGILSRYRGRRQQLVALPMRESLRKKCVVGELHFWEIYGLALRRGNCRAYLTVWGEHKEIDWYVMHSLAEERRFWQVLETAREVWLATMTEAGFESDTQEVFLDQHVV